ncbi:AtpZ/AtpI family protein [Nocardioides sp. zg-1228]|uniref:AtpZ/AtpI family protein n=1 Tax=Nocardioides sp. zg-1228 TaxID=2763008 RepID=UPI0016426C7C|nr:AtpZ/AtpI family protein [Nocardioides sp. zg-1228]MBC2934079.1 AtpZ/AtpI family protein [Nocardioides sp. zg-1228]QSF58831.1 AtpZ/AtpI family protein [Nocardioides sp. zg-1228]
MAESGASSSQPSRISAPSYLVAGVLFYGAVGWLLDQWLDTRFLVAAGVLLGGALGTYMMVVQLNRQTAAEHEHDGGTSNTRHTTSNTNNEESE